MQDSCRIQNKRSNPSRYVKKNLKEVVPNIYFFEGKVVLPNISATWMYNNPT